MTAVQRSAVISPDGRYRYRLDRWWAPESTGCGSARMPFLMCNPSTADDEIDDPTIRRCVGFARREGASGVTVVNLGAYRATDPDEWARAADPIGPDNQRHVEEVADTAGYIVCAWGAHPAAASRGKAVLVMLRRLAIPTMCLGTTKAGHPRHPLYVRGDTELSLYGCEK